MSHQHHPGNDELWQRLMLVTGKHETENKQLGITLKVKGIIEKTYAL